MINGEGGPSCYSDSWNIGTCSKSICGRQDLEMFSPYDVAVQRCCLAPKTYDLTCQDLDLVPNGWSGGAIEILGHRYCDDFVDRIVRRKVEVSCKYRVLAFHLFTN